MSTASIIFLLITSALFYIFKEQEKSLRIFTQQQLTGALEEKHETEKKLGETVNAKKAIEQELDAEKEKTQALKIKLDKKNRQTDLVLNKLEEEISVRRDAESQLLIVLKERKELEEKLREITRQSKLIELEKIVIAANTPLTGEVLVVNKEHHFIVVNLGRVNNVNLGDSLSIYRGNEFIGEAEVERVEEEISAAAILTNWQDREFKEKDIVVRL